MRFLFIFNFILFVYGFRNNTPKTIKLSISNVKKDTDMEVFKEKSYHQKEIMNNLKSPSHKIILINGVSGTGKTYMSISYALRSLLDNVYTSIVITKPMVGVDNEEIGFLPGDLNAKFNNWMAPVINTLYKIMDKTKVIKQIHDKKIMFYPIAFLRGETFDNQLIICDESQNLTPIQMKMLLTRIGKDSKLIFCGDLSQKDFNETSGFDDFIRRYHSFCIEEKENARYITNDPLLPSIKLIQLNSSDIVRSEIIKTIYNIYEKEPAESILNEKKEILSVITPKTPMI